MIYTWQGQKLPPINLMNEDTGDYEPIANDDLSQQVHTHGFIVTNIHRRVHPHTQTLVFRSINGQLIYKLTDLCIGLALT